MSVKRFSYFFVWAFNRVVINRTRNAAKFMYDWMVEGVTLLTVIFLFVMAACINFFVMLSIDGVKGVSSVTSWYPSFAISCFLLLFWLTSKVIQLYHTYMNECWEIIKNSEEQS